MWRVKLPKAVAGARQNVDSAHTKTATDTILCNPALRDCRSIVNRQQGFSYLLFRTIRVSADTPQSGFWHATRAVIASHDIDSSVQYQLHTPSHRR